MSTDKMPTDEMLTDKMPNGQNVDRQNACDHMRRETIANAKYAVVANLFRLGSTNPTKISSPWIFFNKN